MSKVDERESLTHERLRKREKLERMRGIGGREGRGRERDRVREEGREWRESEGERERLRREGERWE